jgi:transitional endoplasmic reticulum ATPase
LSPSYAIIHDKVLFRISGEIKGKSRFEADRVATLVKKECQQHSIYKGQAIETSFPSLRDHEVASLEDTFPTFSKLSKLTEADLIFPVDVWDQVDVSLFTPIKKAQKCRDRQIPLKRGILLEGPFGVGKTLTAAVTQALCKEHGWTFIYLKDVTRLAQAYAFAEQYQPAVIFGEDVDKVVRGDRTQAMDDILNQLDGLNTKGIEVITVLTTNNVEDIIKGMIRPGRLDTVVPVRPPDAEAAARLVRLYARGFLAEGIDLTEVSKLLAGKIPAAIREIVERAKIATLRRDEDDMVIRSEDLIVTARSMQAHMDLLHRKEPEYLSDLEEAALIEAEGRIAAARIIAGLPEASPGTSPVAPVKFVRNNYTS